MRIVIEMQMKTRAEDFRRLGSGVEQFSRRGSHPFLIFGQFKNLLLCW